MVSNYIYCCLNQNQSRQGGGPNRDPEEANRHKEEDPEKAFAALPQECGTATGAIDSCHDFNPDNGFPTLVLLPSILYSAWDFAL